MTMDPPSLISLPFDALLPIVRHLDLASLTRFRSACRVLTGASLLFNNASTELTVLQAFDTGDLALFRKALIDTGHTVGASLVDGTDPSSPPSWRMVCRRRLLEALVWKLVAQRNEDDQAWWALVAFLYDPLNGPRPWASSEEHEAEQVLYEERRRQNNQGLDDNTCRFLERAVVKAMHRHYSKGLTGLASFCHSIHKWVNYLSIDGAVSKFVQKALAAQQGGPAEDVVPERVLVDIQLACLHLSWCGDLTCGPVSDLPWSDWFPAVSANPVVVFTALDLIVKELQRSDPSDPDWLPRILVKLFNDNQNALAFDLLDLYLLSVGTLNTDGAEPLVTVRFPKDTQAIRQDLYRPLGLAGVSPSLFASAIRALQTFPWVDFEKWILFQDLHWCSMSRHVLDWYLSRAPFHLRLLHNLCHDLGDNSVELSLTVDQDVYSSLLDHFPFDLVDSVLPNGVLFPSSCDRCDQLKLLARHFPRDPFFLDLLEVSDSGDNQARSPSISFLPTSLSQRLPGYRFIQSLLSSIPPPVLPVPPPNNNNSNSPNAATVDPPAPTPYGWRAYLQGFWKHPSRAMRIELFWPHTRNSVCDPSRESPNCVPFADLMWALLNGLQFHSALSVLQEARSLVLDPAIATNPFRSWRYDPEELHVDFEDQKDLRNRYDKDQAKEHLLAFIAYVEENGLMVGGKGEVAVVGSLPEE